MNPEQEEFRKCFPGIKKLDDIPDEVLVDESTGFSIRVRKVSTKDPDLRHNLEKYYDWTNLKQFILRDLKMFYGSASNFHSDFGNFAYELEEKITRWLHTFNGWGLKYYLLEYIQEVVLCLTHIVLDRGLKEYKKWSELDPESSFKSFFDVFKASCFWETEKLFEENIEVCSSILLASSDADEWRKILKINFNTLFNNRVYVEFVIVKTPPSRSLADLAAEAFVKDVDHAARERFKLEYHMDDLGPLSIPMPSCMMRYPGLPGNLQILVRNKTKDFYWRFNNLCNKKSYIWDSEDILDTMLPEFLHF